MELIIVTIIIAMAVFFVGRSFYKQYTGKSGCSSGCSCGLQQSGNGHSSKDYNFKLD